MKRKSIISMLLLSMVLGMFSTSCQDMLSPSSERHSYTVAEDTLYSYWGILRSLQNIAERYVILNECRGDLVDASNHISDTIGAIMKFGDVDNPENWKDGAFAYLNIRDYYHVINSCNAYIAMCDTVRTTGTDKKYMLSEYSQVHAIRAWVYMQLLYAYGENTVPFYTEPMLTTKGINEAVDAFKDNKSPKLTAQILVQELAQDLERMEFLEDSIGLPDYNNYGDVSEGNSHFVCHSSKCMFPVSVVLGDLYLLAASAGGKENTEMYKTAAQHYFNYINSKNCGPLVVDRYYSTGKINEKIQETPIYDYDSQHIPYTETSAVSRNSEVVTCIPSNKGKLEGKVLTDINRLFGFEAQLSTSNGGSASARVDLQANYEHELQPSLAYEALCDNQNYEIYTGTPEGNFLKQDESMRLDILPGVGDARRAWIYRNNGKQWTFNVRGKDMFYKMVSKQNPNGQFSTVYPVVYRKSMIWLRYAEALNRAGFPSYAFAILKSGLCNSSTWFPTDPKVQYEREKGNAYKLGAVNSPYYYLVDETKTLYCYYMGKSTSGEDILFPEGWADEDQIHSLDDLKSRLITYYQEEYEESLGTDTPMDAPRTVADPFEEDENIRWAPESASAFTNIPMRPAGIGCACYYLDRRELAQQAPFLNFSKSFPNLRGASNNQMIHSLDQSEIKSGNVRTGRYSAGNDPDATCTIGVHQRGCGFILWNDPESPQATPNLHRSTYNYVTLMKQKIKDATGLDVGVADIYSGDYDSYIRDGIEDLIVDEMALELAFEGTRFSDLYRASLRRGPEYLAERVSKRRTGEVDEGIYSRLLDKKNWFLPVPEE